MWTLREQPNGRGHWAQLGSALRGQRQGKDGMFRPLSSCRFPRIGSRRNDTCEMAGPALGGHLRAGVRSWPGVMVRNAGPAPSQPLVSWQGTWQGVLEASLLCAHPALEAPCQALARGAGLSLSRVLSPCSCHICLGTGTLGISESLLGRS